MPAQPLSLRAWAAERADLPAAAVGVGVVVDAGFSFTHAVPLCDGRVLWPAVRRINLGGKALTNYLKELVSYRCSPGPMSVWLKSMKSICLYYHHFHCTLLLPIGKVHGRRAAGKGCQDSPPCWTRQMQASPNQPWAFDVLQQQNLLMYIFRLKGYALDLHNGSKRGSMPELMVVVYFVTLMGALCNCAGA